MPAGGLLATTYGYFEGDNTSIELPSGNPLYKTPNLRSIVTLILQTSDRGKSWTYLSTVAYDPKAGQEGLCKPSMARLPDGRLLCVMRTGYTRDPMCESWSKDAGKTWSKGAER